MRPDWWTWAILVIALVSACDRGGETAVEKSEVRAEAVVSDTPPAEKPVNPAPPSAPPTVVEDPTPPSTLAPSTAYATRLTDDLYWFERATLTEALAEAAAGRVKIEPTSNGWRIAAIQDGTTAGSLGLRVGDVVRTIEGRPAPDADAWVAIVRDVIRLERFAVAIDRDGRPLVLHYERRDDDRGRPRNDFDELLSIVRLGVEAKGDRISIDRVILQQLASSPVLATLANSRRSSLLAALGVDGENVVAIAEASVAGEPAVLAALGRQAGATEFGVDIGPPAPSRLTIAVIEGRVTEADLVAAIGRLPATVLDPGGGSVGIVAVDETHYTIPKKLRDELLADPSKLMRTMRIVPSHIGGKISGLKLYGIRSRGTFSVAWLGLANGDVVTAINGVQIETIEDAMKVYEAGKKADSWRIDVTRRGTPMVLTWKLEP